VQTVLRQELLEHLARLPAVFELYRNADPRFMPEAVAWLSAIEATLLRFRSPKASQLAAERGLILAAADGYRDPQVASASQAASRRGASATTALCLGRAEAAVRLHVEAISEQLDAMKVKMAQLLAIGSSARAIPMPRGEPRTAWLSQVWAGLVVNEETQRMHMFLAASLATVDRLYLLDELLSNLLTSVSPPPE
jgi:hypothetical protein